MTHSVKVKDKLGVRHVQMVLLAGAMFVSHMQQGNLGIAVVVMTQDIGDTEHHSYDWDKDKLTIITGSFFYSLMASNILAAFLTTRMNNKHLLLAFTAAGTLATYTTPLMIEFFDWGAFFFVRLVQGAVQGFVKPVVYSLLVRWLPPNELMMIGPSVLSGMYLGVGFMLTMGGYLGTGQGGWPSLFYFSGNCGLIWCLAYLGLGAISPDRCFYIAEPEKHYINDSLPGSLRHRHKHRIPWKKIVTNGPLWAALIAQTANNWSFQIFVKITPVFLQNRLGLSLSTTGLLCGIPYLCLCVVSYLTTRFLKFWQKRRKLNFTIVRHLCNAIGQFGAYYCFLICAFSHKWEVNLIFHVLGVMMTSFQLNGFYMNYIDLTPTYCGVAAALCSSVAHITSILGPIVAVKLYNAYNNEAEWYNDEEFISWRRIYDYASLSYFLGGTIFMLFGKVEVQAFDKINVGKSYN